MRTFCPAPSFHSHRHLSVSLPLVGGLKVCSFCL